jgi:hypothetical protein
MMPTGTFSVATAAPAAEEPVPVAMFVEAGSSMRKIRSLRIVEATLFNVTTDGRDMIRILPSLSAASNELARSRSPPTAFWMTETLPPSPIGTFGNSGVKAL